MKLPTIDALTKYVIWFALVDFLFFFYAGKAKTHAACAPRPDTRMPGYPGFSSNAATIVTVFSWLSMALLFVCLTMVVNGYLIRRELLVYFLSLYVRLFALAFQLIALGIGVTHSSTMAAVFT